jgi:choline dehydrogenase-like flavoprotein
MAESPFDVVIIGSGPGGGATAWALTRQGVKVAVLEAGPAYDYLTDYRLHVNEWEQSRFPSRARENESYVVAPLQKLDRRRQGLSTWNHILGASNKSDRRLASLYHHVQGVGGTTLHYLGEAHRLHPEAMRMGSRFGVAADWPFDYGELEPYYVEAERVIGAVGPNQESPRWRSQPYPLPAHPLSYASQKVRSGCRKLGLAVQLLRQLFQRLSPSGQGQRRRHLHGQGPGLRSLHAQDPKPSDPLGGRSRRQGRQGRLPRPGRSNPKRFGTGGGGVLRRGPYAAAAAGVDRPPGSGRPCQ